MFHAPGDMEVTRVRVYTAVRSFPTYLCCSWLNLKLCPCQVVELASMWLLHRTLPADKFEGLPMFKCGISYEDTLGLAKELDVPLKIHCGVPCYVGWSGFILLNIRTFFLTNTLHIIRRESWKIHVTIPTISLPFNGVYVTVCNPWERTNVSQFVQYGAPRNCWAIHESPIKIARDRRVCNDIWIFRGN